MALKGQKTTSDFLEWEKMQSLVLKLERDGELKFALLIATGSYIGLRISDLLQLRWNQVLDQDYFTITEKKTNKTRKVTINPELKTILKRLFVQLEAKENDLLRIEGPIGSFFLRESEVENIIFLATGTGVAPVKSILESIKKA